MMNLIHPINAILNGAGIGMCISAFIASCSGKPELGTPLALTGIGLIMAGKEFKL